MIDCASPSEEGKKFRLTIDTTTSFVRASDWWWGRGDALGVPADLPDFHRDVSVSTVDSLSDGLG